MATPIESNTEALQTLLEAVNSLPTGGSSEELEARVDVLESAHQPVTTAGTGIAYTATVSHITALTAGAQFVMVPHTNSTDALCTLNVNGLGAKYLRRRLSNSNTSTVASVAQTWLYSGKPVTVTYNGSFWVTDMDRPVASDVYGLTSYVTSESTSGIWKIRQWSNGECELWGTVTGSAAATSVVAWGSLYAAADIIPQQTYPVTFATEPYVTYSSHFVSGNTHWLYASDKLGTTTKTPSLSAAEVSKQAVNTKVTFYVKGTLASS